MSQDKRDEVLAWMADTGRGYRAAEKQFGVPRATIQHWAKGEREGSPVASRARTQARARARDEAPVVPTPAAEPAWDPSTCTFEEHLVEGIRRCMAGRATAMEQGHGGVARQWEVTLADYRQQLEEHREAARARAEAKGRDGQVDPDQLCRRLLRQLPALVRLAPDEAAVVHRELGRLLEQRGTG